MRQFQISNSTGFMRYKNIYHSIYRYNLIPQSPRVLVFGCSSGQELKTIRAVWPSAKISGCDIDTAILEKAQQMAPYAELFLSTDENLHKSGTFDLVCCNSVLCRHPLPSADQIPSELPLTDVSQILAKLLLRIKIGGYLMAYNMNYLMSDCEVKNDLLPTSVVRSWNNSFVPRLSREGKITAYPDMEDREVQSYRLVPESEIKLEDLICPLFKHMPNHPGGFERFGDDISKLHVTVPGDFAFPQVPPNKFMPFNVEEQGILDGRMVKSIHTFVKLPLRTPWHYLGAQVEWLSSETP
jgi:hypothetical protein